MIRTVALFELKPGSDPAEVAAIQDSLRGLRCPGTVGYSVGNDLGLRDSNWSFAVVADFKDVDSYQSYDADPEHNEIRGRLMPLVAQAARLQFEIPG